MKKLHDDPFLVIYNKPPGIPVQADKTGDTPLLEIAEKYAKRTLHLVHRMDRPVSGAVLLAKTKAVMTALTEQFKNREIDKEYLAIVGQMPPQQEGTLVHYLRKNEAKNISVAYPEETPGAERAELKYRVLGSSDRYHLLHIQLITGRHHQIRAQLAAIGCPVRGDVKYGFKRANKNRSIDLHAWKLSFEHPHSGETLSVTAPLPEEVVWKAFGEVRSER
ncbi:MAG: RNA pseudouridine synthase [Saprospiraceae bacterium]|nr:RNA pseudouridine synthase [Saprospiraceae bacterium]